ncbi:DUF7089 family protein [Natronobacterium gregoryi]|uniref:Uncharacterized protein n=2 Tax=Natronobacterium gregoryi TaxID=44930 RepID=L0AH92_NATGS|nr:hypothetical protein [Natronobacterium gregoryi]AFZ72804.1 hypothetical protein Natgr_1599 [Natronobacterium gregoryi SP2]ELY69432.1 hypothetical protein C490_07909 [Natronobacterium gregoryi SP2]PLK21144.1 hypothetical protein CYV19_05800 [Natronobacterium gregoryi SP2]SFJ10353.1 hypothetical protein SAMN05443661_11435 [Natronobacterium gregoryi]
MFETRELSSAVGRVRDVNAPEALVFDCETDFETLPPAQAEEFGLVVDSLEPATYPSSWLPADAPTLLARYAGSDLTVGMPGDGSIAWTCQTDPPIVLVKPRVEGTPEPFLDFLLAEAFVEIGLEVPEHFLGFFEDAYSDLDRAVALDAGSTYQVAAALYDGWVGLQSREVFAEWHDEELALADAWQDAGGRLEDRVSGLPRAVARGETEFADATELACAAIKHAIELPAPFAALDTDAYRDHGAEYAVRWAEKTFDSLADD